MRAFFPCDRRYSAEIAPARHEAVVGVGAASQDSNIASKSRRRASGVNSLKPTRVSRSCRSSCSPHPRSRSAALSATSSARSSSCGRRSSISRAADSSSRRWIVSPGARAFCKADSRRSSVRASASSAYTLSGPVRRDGSVQRAATGTSTSCSRSARRPNRQSRPSSTTRGIESAACTRQARERSWCTKPWARNRASRRCAMRCSRCRCTVSSVSTPARTGRDVVTPLRRRAFGGTSIAGLRPGRAGRPRSQETARHSGVDLGKDGRGSIRSGSVFERQRCSACTSHRDCEVSPSSPRAAPIEPNRSSDVAIQRWSIPPAEPRRFRRRMDHCNKAAIARHILSKDGERLRADSISKRAVNAAWSAVGL